MSTLPSGRVVLDRRTTATGEIQLQRRLLPDGSTALEIISDGVFLMASYNQVSERALAQHALNRMACPQDAPGRILVGGLGMGFTLQAVLAYKVKSVDVVEISPTIITWNQTYFAPLNNNALTDPRVRLIRTDLYSLLAQTPSGTYHAILLDVDNGPSWPARPDNTRLYTSASLARWAAFLAPGGVFAVWSAQPEPDFLGRLQKAFSISMEIPVLTPQHNDNDFIYLASNGGQPPIDFFNAQASGKEKKGC